MTTGAATLKTLVFGLSSVAAIFFASAGYGLLKMLLSGTGSGASIGIAEFSTHSGLTIVCFVLAGLGAYVAKKCSWNGPKRRPLHVEQRELRVPGL